MKAIIEITCDNAAFRDPDDDDEESSIHEAARNEQLALILRDLAKHIEQGSDGKSLLDVNGNKVGSYRLED